MKKKWIILGRNIKKRVRYLATVIMHIVDHDYVEKYLLNENKLTFSKGIEFPDETIYYIDLSNFNCGFFAQFRVIIAFLKFAEVRGFLPYVKMDNTIYGDINENVFDIFFKQPFGLKEKAVEKAQKIIYSDLAHIWDDFPGYKTTDDELMVEADIRKRLIRYSDSVETELQEDVNGIFKEIDGKVLGVHIRGGDYRQLWKNHPVPLQINDYEILIDRMIENGYKKIFLATDDVNYLELFKKKYADKIFFYEDVKRTESDQGVHYCNKGFRIGYEALRDMYTLSCCDSLIAGLSHLSTAARIEKQARNESFEFVEILCKGYN